jgi:pyruvate/2-oxoglutarate dehydrogenase complex dihydrolipoamide acyltransferase (E2) component
MVKIILPELGEGIEQATVAYWHCQIGDLVCKDDDMVEVVTDKAAFNIPVESGGIIKKICVQVGETVKIGDVLAVLEN